MNRSKPQACDQTRALTLPYLEDMLTAEENETVTNHLISCADCAKELDALRDIHDLLRAAGTALCRELWELYDFVNKGVDQADKVAEHLSQCLMCREDAELLKRHPHLEVMPGALCGRRSVEMPVSLRISSSALPFLRRRELLKLRYLDELRRTCGEAQGRGGKES